jgi:oligopeptide/dipeptide ABC transporter ATP-binding protein
VKPIIEVRGLHKDYRRGGDVLHAVDGIDLALMPGESVGVVGESGAGKSTLARCMAMLEQPTSGGVFFRDMDVTALSDRALRQFRREVQPVFQDPLTALNPRWTVRRLIAEPLRIHGERRPEHRVGEVLGDVGLPEELMAHRPRDLSGGERQRVAIARAMVLRPAVLILDEPTASVDASTRRALLALLKRLQSEHGLAYLFISHDIRTIEETCSRTIVMYRGRLAEEGPTAAVLKSPGHVYTRILVSAVPRMDASALRGAGRLRARPYSVRPSATGSGCVFIDRCPRALPECAADPPLVEITPGHRAACVLADHPGAGGQPEKRHLSSGCSSAAAMSYPSAMPKSGAAATTRPSPATGATASSTSAISSSLAPAARARAAIHSRLTAGDPSATDTPT